MPLIINPSTGEILTTEDPTGFFEQGYREPTRAELEAAARREEFGTWEQQAQAQAERVVRGATLGAVEGFGDDPEAIRARAEVSAEESPVTSFLADVAPDVGAAVITGGLGGLATGAGRAAARGAMAEGAGVLRAGLSAARAGGAASLAAESAGTGLVGAGQQAYAEGRELGDDIGLDAENALIWGGLNFGLGAVAMGVSSAARKGSRSAADDVVAESLDDVARAAELDAAAKGAPEFSGDTTSPGFSPEGQTVLDAERPTVPGHGSPVDLSGKSLQDLGALHDSGFREGSFKALRESEEFVETGRTPRDFSRSDHEHGIRLRQGEPDEGREWYLVDGRHRLTVAREKGRSTVWGTVYDAEGEQIYRGEIPIADLPTKDVLTGAEKRLGEKATVDDGIRRGVARATEADAEDIVSRAVASAPEAEAGSFGRQRRLYINRDAVMEAAEREFRTDLDGAVKDIRAVVGDGKQTAVASKVSDNLAAQRVAARQLSEQAASFAGELRGEARAFAAAEGKKGIKFAIPGAKNLALALMDNAKAIGQASDGRALFEALDGFKRSAQDIKVSLEQGALNSTNPIHHQQLIPRIDAFERKIRGVLEDSGTWGKAGEMQRAYNQVISDRLMPSLRIFEESVLERTHKGYDALWNMEGWETKIRALLQNTDPGRRRHVGAVFDAMDELASVRRRFGDAKTAERLEGAAAKMRRTIGLADEVADASERMEALGSLVGGGGPMSGAVAGGLMGGLPGAAVGAAVPGFARQFVMGDLVRNLNRLMGASEATAQRGVDDWIRSSRVRGAGLRAKLPKLPELSPEAKQLRDVAARRGVSQGMALFMGEDESPGAAFERMRDALLDDERFFESVSQEYGSVQAEAPELFMALAGRAGLARQFLIQRMPPNVAVSMANPNGYPPSREAIEDWAQYVNAVRYPTRVAKNLAGISVQQVETLRTVHPRFHEQIQQRLIESIAASRQSGEPLDDTFLVRAALLFPDIDGMASPVFSREFGKVVRDYNAQQKQQKAQGAGKPGKPTPSPMMATIERGATFGTGAV